MYLSALKYWSWCGECSPGLFVAGHSNVNWPRLMVIGHLANIGDILNNLHANSTKYLNSTQLK